LYHLQTRKGTVGYDGSVTDNPPELIRDPAELHRRLAERTLDLRTLDLAGFRRWLDLQLARWQSDPVFVQRIQIRDLRKAHPELRELEKAYRRSERADAATPQAARLAEVERERHNANKAITGLTEALRRADVALRPGLEAKRSGFLARQWALEADWTALVESSPERQTLVRARSELDEFRSAIGLDDEEDRLAELQTGHGRGAGRAGIDFEAEAFALTGRYILPEVGADGLHVLRTVRLGAAGVELDLAVVRRDGGPDEPVDVLAVVEAKRNINDLAHGFLRRQIDLAWLTGEPGAYDPAEHRTGQFPTGHFDRPAVHWQEAQAFRFAPDSFRRFVREGARGYYLNGLYLVTRAGPVWGVSAAAQARISARVATDEDWDPADEAYLTRLFAWCRSLARPVETPDALRLYTESAARRLLVIGW
jgi:hypothetical protein